MSDRLLLLDGHSLAYRAFYALPDTIVTKTGQVTNAVYGFTSMLLKLLADQRTDRVAVSFDTGRPTVRLQEYAEYKAGRAETPSEFRPQIGLIREVLEALNIPVFTMEEYEADDVLATIAARAAAEGIEAIIVTADRDFLQLVRPGVSVLFNRRGMSDYTLFDPDEVEKKYGLPPEKLRDYAALKGDTSDNLPGVPGVGDKTASTLIQRFGSIEELYERLDELDGRLKKLRPALEEAREQVAQNKRLTTLHDTLDFDCDPAEIRMGEYDAEEVRRLFLSLEFRTLLERLPKPRVEQEAAAPAEITMQGGDGASLAAAAKAAGRAGVALAGGGVAVAVEEEATWLPSLAEAAEVLADPAVEKIAHDAKALLVAAGRAGLPVANVAFDTQVAAYLLDPAPGSYDPAELSQRYLGRDLPVASPAADDGQLSLLGGDEGPADEAVAACARAAAYPALSGVLGAELERLGMRRLFEEVEMPLVAVLARMEATGVAIDTTLLAEQSAELGKEVAALEAACYEHAGGPFNLNSPPQLREILYDRLGLPPTRKTKTGYSTDAAALEGMRHLHPMVDALLRYRELSKLRSTYLDALPKLVDPADGRLHATFKQTAVATGRISAESPNLQNIPVRTEVGRAIRRAFVAGFDGHVLLAADYSQIELRILAHITGDAGLREAFANDEDVHAATAAKVWGFDPADVPRDLRARAKAINFGLAYGMNAYGLAQRLGVTPDEAQEHIDAYFTSFPGVRAFMVQVVADAYRDGYTVTLLGRRRYLPELMHGNPRIRQLGERQALNAPIQGSAADVVKLAMIAADRGLREAGLSARMVLTVHDELVFEVPEAELDASKEAVRSLMEQAYPLEVPLKVDIAAGPSWADAKP